MKEHMTLADAAPSADYSSKSTLNIATPLGAFKTIKTTPTFRAMTRAWVMS